MTLSKNAKIAIIVGVLVVIGIVAYVVYKNGKKETSTTSSESASSTKTIASKEGSTASNVIALGGDLFYDVANSGLF